MKNSLINLSLGVTIVLKVGGEYLVHKETEGNGNSLSLLESFVQRDSENRIRIESRYSGVLRKGQERERDGVVRFGVLE